MSMYRKIQFCQNVLKTFKTITIKIPYRSLCTLATIMVCIEDRRPRIASTIFKENKVV
jgi:hypothetical protein